MRENLHNSRTIITLINYNNTPSAPPNKKEYTNRCESRFGGRGGGRWRRVHWARQN